MVWFSFLKEKGYFNPDNNPDPIEVKEGYQIPYWEPLSFLEKLSIQIKEGRETQTISEVVSIIRNISQNPKDNYRTWYFLIKILGNLPNEAVTKELLNFLPIWLSGRFDTTIQSMEICENLLPKFLPEEPTLDDIEKSEIILMHLFSIEKKESKGNDNDNYKSKVYLHYLSNSLVTKKLNSKIAKFCSENVILYLAKNVKKLLLEQQNETEVQLLDINGIKIYIKISIGDENLVVGSKGKQTDEFKLDTLTNYEILDEESTKIEIEAILKKQGVKYSKSIENEEQLDRIVYILFNDLISSFSFNSIKKLGNGYQNGRKLLETFSLILRDLLNEKVKYNSNLAIPLLRIFLFDEKYRLPFFKRIILYIIGENWLETKSLFGSLIKDCDKSKIFSNYKYEKELFDLLSQNQNLLTEEELLILEKIINAGPKEVSKKTKLPNTEYWKFRWYCSLSKTTLFRGVYEQLSKVYGKKSNDFQNEGEIQVRKGGISQYTSEDLLEMPNAEIVKHILEFKPKENWFGPNISGLSDALERAVVENPQKFSYEILLYSEVYYIYAYHIIMGFTEAWKNNKTFDWNQVLEFCKKYITNEKFYSGKLSLQYDGWGANSEWVSGAIANLITEGSQSDNNSFDLALLPLVKEIIVILAKKLCKKEYKVDNMDYVTYSFNSNEGKVLRALLDYSLIKARNEKHSLKSSIWDSEIKDIFNEALKKEIIDSYILEGLYYTQFHFLDKEWIFEQVNNNYHLTDDLWKGFFGGFTFGPPPSTKDIYELFFKHYEKAINISIQIQDPDDNGIIRHIVAFYLWGYEDLDDDGLITKFIACSNADSICQLIRFIWIQGDYFKTLNPEEQLLQENLILKLWKFLANKYLNPQNIENSKVLLMLPNLIVFISEIDDVNTELILSLTTQLKEEFFAPELLEKLSTLKNKGDLKKNALNIGKIINSITFRSYHLGEDDNRHIFDIINFMYENKQTLLANAFCNKLTSKGVNFLREIYLKYNS